MSKSLNQLNIGNKVCIVLCILYMRVPAPHIQAVFLAGKPYDNDNLRNLSGS